MTAPRAALARAAEVAGPGASVTAVRPLAGGTHAGTYLVQTENPEREIVVREFPAGDDAARREAHVLGALDGLDGLAPRLLAAAAALVAAGEDRLRGTPTVLTHYDFWSGNVLSQGGRVGGVVDWSGAALGPRGFDLGWCRLDLYLLFDERISDVFRSAYERAIGFALPDRRLFDLWAVARSHSAVEEWVENYRGIGRPDLTASVLRRRHAAWTERLLETR